MLRDAPSIDPASGMSEGGTDKLVCQWVWRVGQHAQNKSVRAILVGGTRR